MIYGNLERRPPASQSRNFKDFFSTCKRRTYGENRTPVPESSPRNRLCFQHWIYISGRSGNRDVGPGSFTATPTVETVSLAEADMIEVNNDRIYFELIVFADEAHLYAKYNQIIGSRLLAELDLDSLPKCVKRHIGMALPPKSAHPLMS